MRVDDYWDSPTTRSILLATHSFRLQFDARKTILQNSANIHTAATLTAQFRLFPPPSPGKVHFHKTSSPSSSNPSFLGWRSIKIFPIFPRNQPVQFVKRPSMAKVRCQSRLLCIIWGEALPNRKNSGSPYFFKPAVVFDDIPFFGSPCVNRYTPTQSPTGWLLIPSKKRVSFYDKNFIINIEFCHKINVGSQRLPCP